jgi:hypothetical protein
MGRRIRIERQPDAVISSVLPESNGEVSHREECPETEPHDAAGAWRLEPERLRSSPEAFGKQLLY